MNILEFPSFNSFRFVEAQLVNNFGCTGNLNPVFPWIFFGKIPENPVVTPSTSVQVIRPSAVNRYLQSVTVNATTTTSAG
jgi:hypothetical protein